MNGFWPVQIEKIILVKRDDEIVLRFCCDKESSLKELTSKISSVWPGVKIQTGHIVFEVKLAVTSVAQFLQTLHEQKIITSEQKQKLAPPEAPPTSRTVEKTNFQRAAEAIKEKNNEMVIKLLDWDPSLINKEEHIPEIRMKLNLLELAAIHDNPDLVTILVNKGVLINRKIVTGHALSPDVKTALEKAEYRLIGSPPSMRTPHGTPPGIEGAIRCHDLTTVKSWLKYDPNYYKDKRVIKYALSDGNIATLYMLLQEGVLLDIETVHTTIVVFSSYSSMLDKTKLLNSYNVFFDSSMNSQTLIKLLQQFKYSLHPMDKERIIGLIHLFLQFAIDWENYGSAILKNFISFLPHLIPPLLENFSTVDSQLIKDLALNCAFLSDETIEGFIKRGVLNNSKDNAEAIDSLIKGYLPLSAQKVALLNHLLEKAEIDWSFFNQEGQPLLHSLLQFHSSWIPQFCLAGANINQINNEGFSLLHRVVSDTFSLDEATDKAQMLFSLNIDPFIRIQYSPRVCMPNATALQLAYIEKQNILAELIVGYIQQKQIFSPSMDFSDTVEGQKRQLKEYLASQRPNPDSNQVFEEVRKLSKERFQIEEQLRQQDILIAELLGKQPVLGDQYDPQDFAEIKAMLEFYVEILSKYPSQVSELLRKTLKLSASQAKEELGPEKAEDDQFRSYIHTAFLGYALPNGEEIAALIDELKEVKRYAMMPADGLRLKSQLNYRQQDIAKMVYDAAIALVLENQEPRVEKAIEDALAAQQEIHRKELESALAKQEAFYKKALAEALEAKESSKRGVAFFQP